MCMWVNQEIGRKVRDRPDSAEAGNVHEEVGPTNLPDSNDECASSDIVKRFRGNAPGQWMNAERSGNCSLEPCEMMRNV